MKRRRLLYLIPVIIIAGLAAMIAFLDWSVRPQFSTPSLEQLQLGFSLPKTARLLHSSMYSEPLHWQRIAVIEYGDSDVRPLVAGLRKMGCRVSRTDRLGMKNRIGYARQFDWWNPDSVRKFIAAGYPQSPATKTHVLISLDDPRQPIVYVFYDYVS